VLVCADDVDEDEEDDEAEEDDVLDAVDDPSSDDAAAPVDRAAWVAVFDDEETGASRQARTAPSDSVAVTLTIVARRRARAALGRRRGIRPGERASSIG
jgi:hypothetical protein